MSHELPVASPYLAGQVEAIRPPLAEQSLPPPVVAKPSPEQVRAVEAIFSQDRESDMVSGLLGMWMGSLLLRDLAVEGLDRPAEGEIKKPRLKDRDEGDQDEGAD